MTTDISKKLALSCFLDPVDRRILARPLQGVLSDFSLGYVENMGYAGGVSWIQKL